MNTQLRARTMQQPTLARLPPLTSLRAFVATARHLSFIRAADELHVTSAAIGQQIRQLEDHLGHALFLRNRGQLQLTDAGQALMPGLTEAFDTVLETMARLAGNTDAAPIRISVAPSFASKWLVPRLAALRDSVPDLEVLLDASTRLADVAGEDTDCVIRYGQGAYPGLVASRLFSEAVLPVCSPDFAERHGLYRGPDALLGVPLLHEDGPERDASCPDWKNWLRSAGASTRIGDSGIRVNQSSLVLDAALAGQGIGLGKLRLAEADLASGRLVSPFGAPQAVEFSYFFATSPHKSGLRRVELFRDWLEAEAAAVQAILPQSPSASVPALAAE
ncbi:transcriptional regulator GcvA [Devosia sp.]|uniref:transcriptional regulator GcvA n=1 Tax=Devosia sp. TaxID=1871048 RepID=UPI002615ED13|nr:transcriptional regulator GcvA [Devosia sp.]